MRKKPSFLYKSEKRIMVGFFVVLVLLYVGLVFLAISRSGISGPAEFFKILFFVWITFLKPIFIVLNIILLGIFLFALIKVWPIRGDAIKIYPKPSRPFEKSEKKKRDPKYLKHWTQIITKANTGRPESIRSAVLEADALVDMFLKSLGFEGEFLADRLAKISKGQVNSLEKLWTAHRVRNQIAHTPGFKVSPKLGQKTLLSYRDFLKEMGAF